jgi:hypothetical protein
VTGPSPDEVELGPALPGWSVYAQVGFVMYDDMFLDSAGLSIWDRNAFQGKFTVEIYGGFSLSWPLTGRSTAIAQTSTIPAWANTLLFDAALTYPRENSFLVSIGGESLPFYALASYTNYTLYAVDVSRFSGQIEELRFTADPHSTWGVPPMNAVYLDDIRFSSSPLAAPPLILAPPRGQTVSAGSNVEFTVTATGFPAPTYQWFFNGTNVIAGATSPVLQLTNLLFSQSGAYTVVITNTYGAVTSPPAILTVRDPFILSQPAAQSANAGQTVFFSV